MNDRKNTVLAAVQRALLEEVGPRLRAVTVSFDETSIHLDCYYDGEIADDDRESMSCAETELMAEFPETHVITHQVHRLDFPARIPGDKIWAYHRREPFD